MYDGIPNVVDEWGPKRVLRRLCIKAKPIEMTEAAETALADLAPPRKRLALAPPQVANRVALQLLDACALQGDESRSKVGRIR